MSRIVIEAVIDLPEVRSERTKIEAAIDPSIDTFKSAWEAAGGKFTERTVATRKGGRKAKFDEGSDAFGLPPGSEKTEIVE